MFGELSDKFQCKNHVLAQKLKILASSWNQFWRHYQLYLRANIYVKINFTPLESVMVAPDVEPNIGLVRLFTER